jgi:SIR2-like domain
VIIDTARNRAAYLGLVELVRSRRALAFVGAGVTCPLGYPTWGTLIADLAAAVRAAHGEQVQSNGQDITVEQVLREFKHKPLVQAQILKESLGDRYFPMMARLFGPKDRRIGPIADLVSLPFKHLLTSNYDPTLEQHHYPPNEPVSISLHHPSAPQFIVEFADDNYTRRIVHVHGRYDEAQYIILTEEDYRTYIRSVVLDDFWRVVPATGRFVFFGFGFEDFDLLYTFRRRMALQGNNPGLRHFAIMPLDNLARENALTVSMRMEYGVEPVFFPHPGTSFAEYDDLLSTLKADVSGRVPEQVADAVAAATVVHLQIPEPGQAAALAEEPMVDKVQQGIERLKEMTRQNIARRQTGDLE